MDNIYILMCGFLLVSLIQADCPYKECECGSSSVFCMNQSLNAIPPLNTSATGFTSLTLHGTQITTIPAGSLPPNLTEIYLIDNPIATIDDAAFDGSASTLRRLAISNARFNRIPNAFSHLRNLQALHIIGVPVTDWNVDAMKNIGSTLETLYIELIEFTSSPTWLQYFSRLTELNIFNSFLPSLPDNAMDLLRNTIMYLTLYNTSLTEVPKAISNVKSLVQLYLTNNIISNTTWLPSSSKLQSLSLNRNRIYNPIQLSNSLRPYADTLVSFDIESNELSALPDVSFLTGIGILSFVGNNLSDSNAGSMPPNLYSLNLMRNFLPRIPRIMSGLQYITDLTLPDNYITMIQSTDFPPNATSVELGQNHITELSDNSFPENSVIQYLYLNNNPISKISPSAFNNLQQLAALSLQATQLTRMPLALSSLTNLFVLDFTNTTSLVCTCLEKSLETWVMARGSKGVSGDCGQITIYEFFTTLSPECPTQ